MMWKTAEPRYEANPVLSRHRHVVHPPRRPRAELLDDRHACRGLVPCRPYSACAAACAALRPRHGGANEASSACWPRSARSTTCRSSSGGEGGTRPPAGLRAPGVQELRPASQAHQTGRLRRLRSDSKSPLLDIALKLEEVALADGVLTSRKLYPNVDFYSGLIYQRWASRWRCSLCCSPSRGQPVGWRTGSNCWIRDEDRPSSSALYRQRPARLHPARAALIRRRRRAHGTGAGRRRRRGSAHAHCSAGRAVQPCGVANTSDGSPGRGPRTPASRTVDRGRRSRPWRGRRRPGVVSVDVGDLDDSPPCDAPAPVTRPTGHRRRAAEPRTPTPG